MIRVYKRSGRGNMLVVLFNLKKGKGKGYNYNINLDSLVKVLGGWYLVVKIWV